MTSTARRKPLVIGNWKMNGSTARSAELLSALAGPIDRKLLDGVDVVVCPPYPYLPLAIERLAGTGIGCGAQDVAEQVDGAFTGEVSAAMLADIGCTHSLIGHSERRTLYGETDDLVRAKAGRLLDAGIVPVICVGETREERDAGLTEQVLARQLDAVCDVLARAAAERVVLAYEPVWAIGTGLTASPEQAQQAHGFIRVRMREAGVQGADGIRLLYGGSVKASNAAALFTQPDVDGGLIGGASLVAADFAEICRAAAAAR